MAYSSRIDQPPASKHGEYKAPRRRSNISGPLTFAIVIVAMIFVMSVLFRVSEIKVIGNEHYTADEIISAIDIEDGDNLFFFDRFAAISRVFAKLPYVEEVAVSRSLPNKVVVEITECKALAYLSLGDEEWTIDKTCKVLGKAAEGETVALIPIYGTSPGTLMIGEKMELTQGGEELVTYISDVLYQIQERGLGTNVTAVDFSDPDHVSFSYGGKFTVEIGDNSNVEHKFGMFVAVLDKLKSGDVGIIDVSDGVTAHFRPN